MVKQVSNIITYQDNSAISYDEWLLNRNKTLGASELGPLIHGSRWTCNLEIFYNKVTGQKKNVNNIRTYLGRKTEDINGAMYCYFDNDDTSSIVRNEESGRRIKEIYNPNRTIFNSKYPHLSATPDREILPRYRYEGRKGNGALELKNSQRMVLDSYEQGIPTDNIFQVCGQMMIGEYEYADLFYFLDNRSCEEHHFERKATRKMEEVILLHTVPFWDNVVKARELYNQWYEARRNFNMRLAEELQLEIARLEPPAQNTDGYLNYITERYKAKQSGLGTITGTEAQLELARQHQLLGKKIGKLEDQQRLIQIQLKEALKENNVLDFGKHGRVTWYANKNDKRTLSIKLK
jgi:predicted phage-related endonuclease